MTASTSYTLFPTRVRRLAFQQKSLAINVFEPLVRGTQFIETVNDRFETWKHTIAIEGGYKSASFRINARQDYAENWLQDGPGRHVACHDPTGVLIWEGFVNKVSLTIGGFSIERGELVNICNRLQVNYTKIVKGKDRGGKSTTATVNNTVSQASYGIFQKALTGGEMNTAEALQTANSYLAEHARPETNKRYSSGRQGSGIQVTVDCLGYYSLLDTYLYNDKVNTADVNLSAKLQSLVNAEPNNLINRDYALMATNTLKVSPFEDVDGTAWSHIKALVAEGDANFNRYLFGVYGGRRVIYEQAPNTIYYQQRMSDPEARIETIIGQRVNPWNVLPGKWLIFLDLLVGRSLENAILRDDPRVMFIEEVTFTAPWGLDLSGGRFSTIEQRIAQKGLSGVSS